MIKINQRRQLTIDRRFLRSLTIHMVINEHNYVSPEIYKVQRLDYNFRCPCFSSYFITFNLFRSNESMLSSLCKRSGNIGSWYLGRCIA